MAISRREALKRGISYGTGVITHGNDSIAFDRALRAFPADGTYRAFRGALDAGDVEAAREQAEAFRRLCGSLAMSELYMQMGGVLAALAEDSLPAVEDLEGIEAGYQDIVGYLAKA